MRPRTTPYPRRQSGRYDCPRTNPQTIFRSALSMTKTHCVASVKDSALRLLRRLPFVLLCSNWSVVIEAEWLFGAAAPDGTNTRLVRTLWLVAFINYYEVPT